MMLEKPLESPLNYKEIKPVKPKGNQSCIFTGGTDAEAPILWPPDTWLQRAKSLEKTLILEKIVGRRRRGQQRIRWLDGITNSMNGHEFEQTSGDSEGQGSLYKTSSGNSLVV